MIVHEKTHLANIVGEPPGSAKISQEPRSVLLSSSEDHGLRVFSSSFFLFSSEVNESRSHSLCRRSPKLSASKPMAREKMAMEKKPGLRPKSTPGPATRGETRPLRPPWLQSRTTSMSEQEEGRPQTATVLQNG